MNRLKKGIVSPLQKNILYLISTVLWLTGCGWLYFQYCLQSQGEFGPQSHPAQVLLLKLHGAAAMGFLIIFGVLLFHVQPGWLQKRQRPSGLILIVSVSFLILTGWGLYYIGTENVRSWTSIVHSVLGVLLPGMIFFHVWRIVAQRNTKTK